MNRLVLFTDGSELNINFIPFIAPIVGQFVKINDQNYVIDKITQKYNTETEEVGLTCLISLV